MITETKIEMAKEHLKECKDCFANTGKCIVQSNLLDMINKYEAIQNKIDNAISCKSCNVKTENNEYSSNTFLSFLFNKDKDKDLTIVGANLDLEKLLVAKQVISNKISEFKGEM